MRLNLLIDLDDTLLQNNMGTFIPAYLKALSTHLSSFADPNRLVSVLLDATNEMIRNNQPTLTLKEVFDSAFYPGLGIQPKDMKPAIDSFYAHIFPSLKELTSPMEGAPTLIEEAFRRGYQVAIATNPLFPQTAIHQRLEWAGLPSREYEFEIIPSYETFHFAKPNPAFFAELLANLGWPDVPAIMLGDDINNDIKAARQAGIPAFWLNSPSPTLNPGEDIPTGSKLADALAWLDNTSEAQLQPDFTSPSAMLAILRSTPAALKTMTSKLELAKWQKRPREGEWSQTEVLCHLRDVEAEVNLPRISKVLEEPNPFLPGKDTDPWADERKYINQDGNAALNDFIHARQKLLAMLDQISDQTWKRQARHAIFGPTTLLELVNIIVRHDRLHIQQIHTTTEIISQPA